MPAAIVMAPRTRLLPAFAALLVPLLLLGWFGQSELQRLGERAERALAEQALLFLKAANLRLEEQMASQGKRMLDASTGFPGSLPQVARALGEHHPEVMDLFVLDGTGLLTFPRTAPLQAPLLPYAAAPATPQLNAAELLELAGDFAGAAALYKAFLERPGILVDQKLRAEFSYAGVQRRLGDWGQAREAYEEARVIAELGNREPGFAAEAPAIALLCRLALAELADAPRPRLDLMNAIADGKHAAVADELLQAVFQRLASGYELAAQSRPASPNELGSARDAERTFSELLNGRRFAREYRDLVQETVRRRLAVSGTDGMIVMQQGQGLETALLVARECTAAEKQLLQARLRESAPQTGTAQGSPPRWLGLRISAGLALNAWMDPFLTPDAQGFSLAILDMNGTPVLPLRGPAVEASRILGLPDVPTVGDLRLRALPVDPEAFVRSAQAATRNRKLLLLGLVLLAAGGAFFLARSAARDAEQAAERMRFVSRVSHELKTPLALIKMYAETVLLGRARGQQDPQRCASIISREADRLTTMIERVLDFSRSEAGTLRYSKERVDVSDLLLTVSDEYRPRADDQGARLVVTFEDQLWVEVDPEAMQAAIVNLLENAVKYTPPSAPDRTVEVDIHSEGDKAILEVRDRGIGIPESERQRVFDGFFRASNSGEVRGFGLGLSLVRHFVEHHGGTVEALGREGGGTVIRMSLPRAAPPAPEPAAPREPVAATNPADHEERS